MKPLVLVLVLLLAGCPSAPMTPGDALGAAYLAADTMAVTTHELCGNAEPGGDCAPTGRISTETKNMLRDELIQVAALLHEARELLAIGDDAAGMDALTRARVILRTAETILTRAQQ